MGLQDHVQTVTVNVLNDEEKTSKIMPVEYELESLNGFIYNWQSDRRYAANRLGKTQWEMETFKRNQVYKSIGLDYSGLHYSYRDIRWRQGEPMTRLNLLGWTCIGNPENGQSETHSNRTISLVSHWGEIDAILQRFWDIESVKPLENSLNISSEDLKYTKRNFLSKIAMLFDSLSFIASFTIRGKMLLQDMWISGYKWDDNLDEKLMCKAKSWFSELVYLKRIKE